MDAVVYSADEVAELLGLDRKSVYAAAKHNQIPHRRVGRRILFPRAAIEAWLSTPAVQDSTTCKPLVSRRRR